MDNLTPIYQAALDPNLLKIASVVHVEKKSATGRRGKDRLPRLKRALATELRPIVLTPRDIEIIEAVYRYRVMSTDHIDALLFNNTTSPIKARRRLSDLFHHGYLHRNEQMLVYLSEGRKSLLYFLDKKGAELLAQSWGISAKDIDWSRDDWKISPYRQAHLLAIQNVRVNITVAAQAHGLELIEWKDEKTLKREHRGDPITIANLEGREENTYLIPDGYIHLAADDPTSTSGKRHWRRFLEIDRATETAQAQTSNKRAWDTKIKAYLSYYRAGKFHQRYHAKGMGLLTVTTGEKRLASLKRATEAVGGETRYWFTTVDRLSGADILRDPIWSVASIEERRSILGSS